jgi:putative Mg2+ transporter-C (MgtC) family protein
MHTPAEFLDPTIVMLGKMVLAMVLGGVIGTERAIFARQAAGTRTFGLVALGACLFVLMGLYVDSAYIGIVNFDPMRIAAGIITGIGFLGAGLIVFRGDTVHGATTAAGLWIATSLGMSVGYGMYAIAIFGTILALIMFTGMWYVENRFKLWFGERDAAGASVNPPRYPNENGILGR